MPSTIKQCKIMQNSCHAMQKTCKNKLLLRPVHRYTGCSNSIFSAQSRVKKAILPDHTCRCAAHQKNWPNKKRMARTCCRTWAPAGTQRFFAGRDAGAGRLPLGLHRVEHLRAEPRGRGDAAARAGAHRRRVAKRGAHGQAQRERDERPVGAQHGGGLRSSKLDGAGADFSQTFAYKGDKWCGTSSTRGGC